MDSSNGKRSDRDTRADSWGTYKLRSPRKRVGHRHVEEPDGATSDSDVSESESEGSESEKEGSRSSRSSARHASSVMAKFCEAKRKAVSEIVYGGVLQLGLVNKVNLKFTAWLFSRIDLKTRSMPVGSDGRVFLCPEHVEKVIGVPSRGRQVCGLESDDAQERSDFVRLAMGATQFCSNPLKAAQSVVTRQWKDDVTPSRVDEFKVAFVVWINGRFLAPTTKQYLGYSDFWGALYNTDEIVEYNWGAYYLDHMLGAAARVQDDIKHKRSTTVISSCPLLAQMIYFDNIELGILSKPHSVFPGIIDFDSGTLINKMIKADMLHKLAGQCDPSWGASRARRREDSCYMASQKGQSSSTRVRRPGKGLENSILVDGRTVGPSFSPAILRPVNASDFYEFLRLGYPDMMDSELVDHLKVSQCALHTTLQHLQGLNHPREHEARGKIAG
ncbi:unnamed protein product [Alopecurus aequalis]